MWEFKKGGVVDHSSGAVVEMSYRVEGNELVFPPATIGGPDQRQTMTWIGNDRLSLREGGQPVAELARKGPGSDTGGKIVGEWGGVRDMGGTKVECLYLFYADGKALLLIRFRPEQGSYSIDNGKIHLDLLGRPSVDGAFKVDGEVLTLTMAERSSRYTRY
jgi:hypothetical protein